MLLLQISGPSDTNQLLPRLEPAAEMTFTHQDWQRGTAHPQQIKAPASWHGSWDASASRRGSRDAPASQRGSRDAPAPVSTREEPGCDLTAVCCV